MSSIPADRMLLALISVMRTLVLDLSRKGVLNADEFIADLQQVAIAHREAGDPNRLADAIHAISEHIQESMENDGDSVRDG